MQEYFYPSSLLGRISDLQAPLMPLDAYKKAHEGMVILCHDVFIEYEDSILLIIRDNHPAKNLLWPLGGRVLRGMNTEESLIRKVQEEAGLQLTDVEQIGAARTYFGTEPFGHGKGTDTFNLVYYAKGEGEIQLDEWHSKPLLVGPADYNKELQGKLSPYVKDFMDVAIHKVGKYSKDQVRN